MISIKNTKKYGRGLYAVKNIKKGEIVLRDPVLEVGYGFDITASSINCYVFGWERSCSAIALGLSSLINHSKRPNVTYNPVFRTKEIIFVATKDIRRGHQLFIDYGYDPKRGKETTERNLFKKLKSKYESDHGRPDGVHGASEYEEAKSE